MFPKEKLIHRTWFNLVRFILGLTSIEENIVVDYALVINHKLIKMKLKLIIEEREKIFKLAFVKAMHIILILCILLALQVCVGDNCQLLPR